MNRFLWNLGAPFRAIKRMIDARDIHAYGGAALLGYGLWLIEPAFAFIGVGSLLVYLGVWR